MHTIASRRLDNNYNVILHTLHGSNSSRLSLHVCIYMVIYVQSYIINSPMFHINFLQRECCGFLHTISADIRAECHYSNIHPHLHLHWWSWRKDGTMLSDNSTYSITSQKLTDAETATYTHTLTMTGSMVGEYECSVSNMKPSKSNRMRTIVGKNCYYTASNVVGEPLSKNTFTFMCYSS